MNRFIKFLIAAVLTVALIVAGYFLVYLPYLCDITISIATPVNAREHYFEDIMLIYSHMPQNKIPLAKELTDTHQEFKMNFCEEHKADDYHIEIDVAVDKGKTFINYEGTITDSETGIEEPFEKEFVHDFILTKKVQ